MKLYDGIVRLEGSVANEVAKTGMTAAEVEVLRALHGADAVVGLKPSKPASVKRTSVQERERLMSIYADSSSLTAVDAGKKAAMFTELFGHARSPLPEDLDLSEPTEDEVEGDGIIEAEAAAPVAPVKTATRTKQPADAYA